jgi:hypothetical protein
VDNDELAESGIFSIVKHVVWLFFLGIAAAAIVAMPLLLAGLGFGWALHLLAPSIEFGASILISLTALGFAAIIVTALFLSLPKRRDWDDDEEDLRPIYILPESPAMRRKKPRRAR